MFVFTGMDQEDVRNEVIHRMISDVESVMIVLMLF